MKIAAPRLDRGRTLRALGYALIAVTPALLFSGVLARGEVPNFMDPVMQFLPWRVHSARLLHGGEWPLWNRCMMAGVPLFENPQVALMYPAHWPFLVWPGGFWWTFPQVAQFGLYAALTIWALRRMGLAFAPALFAGAVAIAGSYGWSRLQYGNYINVLPWWPLWLGAAYGFVAAAAPRRGLWLIGGACAVALSILAGAHQLCAYGLAALSIYSIVQIAVDRGRRVRWLAFWVATFGFGLLIAAPGWLPQIFFIKETSRAGGLEAQRVLQGTLKSRSAVSEALIGSRAILGRASDAESQAVVGWLVVVCALLYPGRRWWRPWLACLVVAGVSLALTLEAVMRPLLEILPQAGLFHGPRRWLGVTQWFLILAGAIGLRSGYVLTALFARRGWLRVTRRLLGAIISRHVFGWYPAVWKPWLARAARDLVISIIAAGCLWKIWRVLHNTLLHDNFKVSLIDLEFFLSGILLKSVFVVVLLLAIARLLNSSRWRRRLALAALVFFLFRLAFTNHMTDLSTRRFRDIMRPDPPPLIAAAGLEPGRRFMTIDWSRSASYDFRRRDLGDWALPNHGTLWGLEDIGGYDPAQSRRYRRFMDELHRRAPSRRLWPHHFGLVGDATFASYLDRANIHRAIMPRWGLPHDFWRDRLFAFILYEGTRTPPVDVSMVTAHLEGTMQPFAGMDMDIELRGGETTWRDEPLARHPMQTSTPYPPQRPLPREVMNIRERFVHQVRIDSVPADAQMITAGNESFFWTQELREMWQPVEIRERAALFAYQGRPSWTFWAVGRGRVLEQEIRANRIELEVEVEGTRFAELVIHDAFWPGWRAEIDGVRAEIRPDGLWRRISVPPGRHAITMTYRPSTVPASFGIAGIGLLGLALAVRWRRPAAHAERGG